MRKTRKIYIVLSFLLLEFIIFLQVPDKYAHIYALDVGQGDAFLVKTQDKKYILIDAGPDNKVIPEIQKVLPFWDRVIDLVILTHPDQDHVGGMPFVLNTFKVKNVAFWPIEHENLAYKQFQEIVRTRIIRTLALDEKSNLQVGCCTYIDTLWPTQEALEDSSLELNELSLSFVLLANNTSTFFGGDLGKDLEIQVFSTNKYDIDILKVGHHGSKHSTSEEFLKLTTPELALVGVGENNFGHPSPEVLTLLSNAGVKIYRTDQSGTLDIRLENPFEIKTL